MGGDVHVEKLWRRGVSEETKGLVKGHQGGRHAQEALVDIGAAWVPYLPGPCP